MYLVKSLIMIISISSYLTLKTKLKQEQSIVISFLGINLIFYVLGIFNLFQFAISFIWIITLISFINLIIMLLKDKTKIKRIFTLSTIIYIVILVITFFITDKMHFTIYDEYMFWGTNVKSMVHQEVLWGNKNFDGVHITYPPLVGINEYIFCKLNGGFTEGCAIFANITFLFTIFLYLFKDEKWNIQNFLKQICTYMLFYWIILLLQFKLSTLLIDLLLGVTFFVSFYVVYSRKSKDDYFILTVLLITLSFIKVTGILLAFVVLSYLLINDIIENKNIKLIKRIKPTLIILLVLLVLFFSWQIYCILNNTVADGRHDKHSTNGFVLMDFLNALILNAEKCTEKSYYIVLDFYNYLLFSMISIIPHISSIMLIVLINFIFVIMYLKRKNKRIITLMVVLDLGFIGYALSILVTFLYVFVDFQGEVLMGVERYINTYLIVYILFTLFIVNESFNGYKLNIEAFILMILIVLGINDFYIIIRNAYYSDIPNRIEEDAKYLNNNLADNEKVFIVIQDSTDYGINFMKLRFLIAPVKTNLLYEWNITIGEPDIYYQTKVSEEELEKILIDGNYDYIYLAEIDEKFKSEYSDLFENLDLDSGELYKIKKEENDIYFVQTK